MPAVSRVNWSAAASRRVGVLAIIVFLTGAAPAPPQAPQTLPTVQQVLERFVTVSGGRDALLRHSSITMHARDFTPATKMDQVGVIYTKNGKSLTRVTNPDGSVAMSGYDGETAWSIDSKGKVSLAKGDVIKTVARDADMYYHLHVMNYFRSMDVVGVATFNGRRCYHLKGVNNWGQANEQYYDVENGLLVGYRFNTAWRGGNGAASATFENYTNFGGVRMPAKTTSRDGSDMDVLTMTSVTYDDVSDTMFVLPPAVRKAKAAGKSGD